MLVLYNRKSNGGLKQSRNGVEEEGRLVDDGLAIQGLLDDESEDGCRRREERQMKLANGQPHSHMSENPNKRHVPIIASRPFLISFV
jgi:hypothetical protein